ncbi:hypothetical protein ACFX2G_029080 [Malus domestica]
MRYAMQPLWAEESSQRHLLVLYPHLKPNFVKQTKSGRSASQVSRSQTASTTETFISNPSTILSEFTSFIHENDGSNPHKGNSEVSTAVLFGQFTKFLQTKAFTT